MRLPSLNSCVSWLEVSVRSHCTQLGWCEEVLALPGDPPQVTPHPVLPLPSLVAVTDNGQCHGEVGGTGGDSAGLVCVKAGQEEGARPQVDQTPVPPNTHTHTHTHPEDENHAVQLCSWQRKGSLSARNGAWISDRLEQPVQSRERELNSSCIIHTADLNQVLGDSWKGGAVSPEPGEETFMVFCHPQGAGERTR